MAKKKSNVKKKVSVSKNSSKKFSQPVKKKCCYSWIWYLLGTLVLLGVLYLLFNGMTGNVSAPITGNAQLTDIFNDNVKPILEYVMGWEIDSQ